MRSLVIALSCLATSISLTAFANGQSQLSDPKATPQLLWSKIYEQGGKTLYCSSTFTSDVSQLKASPVYSAKQLKSALRCVTDRQCNIMNPRYVFIASDLHNYYPALSQVDQARSNAQFGTLDDSAQVSFAELGCEMKTSFKMVEPRDDAKGNVARALFYMHVEYDLPIPGDVATFKQWHEMDPPDADERLRNDKIEALQGSRNRFIDTPALVNELIKE
ncbi:endonuclease [Ectopseudomonas mendocina]|uniref:Endonuclease n=1 Tax=Ectopseudomonas mendocina TaxID=300 RepID=A0ABZ2RJ96_ECTME